MEDSDEAAIVKLATGIMMAVNMTGVLDGADEATMSYAGDVTRGELISFTHGEGEYGEALQGLDDGTVSVGNALVLVVSTCVKKIAEYREIAALGKAITFRETDSQ